MGPGAADDSSVILIDSETVGCRRAESLGAAGEVPIPSAPNFSYRFGIWSIMVNKTSGMLLAWMVGATSMPGYAGEFTIEHVMQSLAKIRVIDSPFVETKKSMFLTDELELAGTIRYHAPDWLEKTITEPFGETTLIDGDLVTIRKSSDERQVRRYSLDASPVIERIVDSVRATLAGDLPALERHYRANLWGEESAWELLLIPRDPELQEFIEQIRIRGAAGRIVQIETYEADGDESVLRLTYDDAS